MIKLLIKFLWGNNAIQHRTCTVTSNLSFSGEMVVGECPEKIRKANKCGICQN